MRLIDADALAKELMHEGLGYQYNRVMCAPTVDAVQVIRCKDCKAYRNCKCVKNNMIAVRDSDFCSRAERKEE